MRLTNLLKLPGGVHEQGRAVRFTLRYMDGKIPAQREVEAIMLPVSEVETHRAQVAARDAAAQDGAQLPEPLEFVVQFMARALRDPGDLAAHLIEDPRDMQALRDGLVAPQYAQLTAEYRGMMASEYGDPTAADEADLKREAADFFGGAQK